MRSAFVPSGGPAAPRARTGVQGLVLRLAVAALIGGLAAPAQAGLFDDEEARKAIVELRARLAQVDEAHRARQAELVAANGQLLEQITALRRSLLELNNQIEALRLEQAKLRGTDEQTAREIAELQRRQRDMGQTLDDRVRRLEPVKVSLDGREFLVDPEEKRAYDEALAMIRTGDFDRSASMLGAFQRRWPGSPYADSVRFWLGNAQYGRKDHKEAIATFRAFVAAAPDHPRAAEALLAVANSQAETKDVRGARKTLEDLIKAYPSSEAATAARERLPTLK